jgi:hypothetical protein
MELRQACPQEAVPERRNRPDAAGERPCAKRRSASVMCRVKEFHRLVRPERMVRPG